MKSREFFSAGGEPIDNIDIPSENHPDVRVASPEFEKYLGEIDLDAIRFVLQSLIKKSDIDPESMNFVPREKINFISDELTRSGEYVALNNTININFKILEESSRSRGLNPKLSLLDTIMHEEIHAVSKLNCKGLLEFEFVQDGQVTNQSGYGIQTFVKEDGEESEINAYLLFDEGVTELLSRQTVERFLQSHPEFAHKSEIDAYLEFMKDDSVPKSYNIPVTFVEAFIEKIAHETNVSKDTVWGAIIRGKLEGENLDDDEFRKAADEIIGPTVLSRLSEINDPSYDINLARLLYKMNIDKINPELWQRMQIQIDAVSRARQNQKPETNRK